MIQINGLKKQYRSGETVVQALRGVDLEIQNGEFLSIAGPSGSGKTTLLNLIGCLDIADEGSIHIDSVDIAEKTRKELALLRREKIGFVFQSFNLIPVLTAYENASFPLSLLGVTEKELHERTVKIMQEVGLEEMMHRKPAELSGGQQQRVAIARALIKSPDIVLADEPTANLDSETGQDILDLMEVLNAKHNTTFIFSTHDQMVMDFAHRLVRLHDGLIHSDELTRRAAGGTKVGSRG
ncbi:MAG: ABC transporter ATP-binding protein [Spirochaetaceae bacterium]|nr:ABC transporter ATP-binding protein [Spirochaetaceae bacterium]MCF7949098.1 ABC transporter ATP-binding protein [Spirochaetia bacterium]MCF7951553.1 ABC transporter ATP-binding protein [Spirochaetaceae bacterium]